MTLTLNLLRVSVFVFGLTLSACQQPIVRPEVPPIADVSSGENIVTIAGSTSGPGGWYCYLENPATADTIVVEAGPIHIDVICDELDPKSGKRGRGHFAKIDFDAWAGRKYKLIGYSDCSDCSARSAYGFDYVELLDQTDGNSLVSRKSIQWLRPDRDTPFDTEIAFESRGSLGPHCAASSWQAGWMSIKAQPLQLEVVCGMRAGAITDKYLSFDAIVSFDAKSGHLYWIHMLTESQHKICVSDISEKDLQIMCVAAQPAQGT